MADIENAWLITGIIFLLLVGFIIGALLFRTDCPTCEEVEEIDCDSDEMWNDETEKCENIECPPLHEFDKDLAKCVAT